MPLRLRAFAAFALAALLCRPVIAQEALEGCLPIEFEEAAPFHPPTFEQYPVAADFKGPIAAVRMNTREARTYRTKLREQAKEGPNFAGHYKITQWGCGTGCLAGAIIDEATGEVFDPEPGYGADFMRGGTDFNLNSNLLVLTKGIVSQDPEHPGIEDGIDYYLWEKNKLRLIRHIPSHKKVCEEKEESHENTQ